MRGKWVMAYPNYFNEVHKAVFDKHIERLRGLLRNGFEVNPVYFGDEEFASPLHVAVEIGASQSIIKTLLDAGAEIDGRDWLHRTPFFIAAQHHRPDTMRTLIYYAEKAGLTIDVDVQNILGFTAMHIAARDANLPMLRLLMANGARQDIENKEGFQPADLASDYYLIEMLG